MRKSVFIGMTALLMGLTACEHKELCYHHPHTAKVRVNVDWSQFAEEQPTGMTVMAFPVGGGKPVTVLSNTLDHVYMSLQEGLHHTLSFNQSTTEFGSFSFRDMDSWEKAEVVSNTVTSRWYQGRSEGERVATEPEWLATDTETDARVTAEMIEATGKHNGVSPKAATDYVIASHTPKNIVYTLHVKVNIPGGIYNLRSARAALDGLAEGVKFSTLRRSDEVMTHLLEEWKMTVDKDAPTRGYITASRLCFGLPSSHQGVAAENHFLLSMLLVDGKTQIDVPFEVGHLIKEAKNGTLTLYLELDLADALPDVKPEGGASSGFDAVVEDWGEEIEHEIQM